MPSLHACDSLIVGVVLVQPRRATGGRRCSGSLWPAWVWFAVMATGNHFWLDCLAGVGVALIAMTIVYKWSTIQRAFTPHARWRAAHHLTRCYGPTREQGRRDQAGLHRRRALAGDPLDRWSRAHPRHAERADDVRRRALRAGLGASSCSRTATRSSSTGSARCCSSSGSILDILDGALARAGGKSTPFGAFLDSTTDRVSEGFMLAAIAYVFARHNQDVFVVVAVVAVAGSFLVSYTRARAEALGLKGDVGIGSRAERVVVITAGLVLAPWGVLPWAIALLAATAWITVAPADPLGAQAAARPRQASGLATLLLIALVCYHSRGWLSFAATCSFACLPTSSGDSPPRSSGARRA